MAPPSSKRNTTRQLPETRTLYWPARPPLQGMQPEARHVGAARMRRLLQAEQDTLEPWHETGKQPRGIVALVQRPQSLVPDLHDSL